MEVDVVGGWFVIDRDVDFVVVDDEQVVMVSFVYGVRRGALAIVILS